MFCPGITQTDIDVSSVIFCNMETDNAKLVNTIILIFKQCIYVSKTFKTIPTFKGVLTRIVEFHKIEYRVALNKSKVSQYVKQESRMRYDTAVRVCHLN